jgi:hypothetical protein
LSFVPWNESLAMADTFLSCFDLSLFCHLLSLNPFQETVRDGDIEIRKEDRSKAPGNP